MSIKTVLEANLTAYLGYIILTHFYLTLEWHYFLQWSLLNHQLRFIILNIV